MCLQVSHFSHIKTRQSNIWKCRILRWKWWWSTHSTSSESIRRALIWSLDYVTICLLKMILTPYWTLVSTCPCSVMDKTPLFIHSRKSVSRKNFNSLYTREVWEHTLKRFLTMPSRWLLSSWCPSQWWSTKSRVSPRITILLKVSPFSPLESMLYGTFSYLRYT